jgi:hypothetical protein
VHARGDRAEERYADLVTALSAAIQQARARVRS